MAVTGAFPYDVNNLLGGRARVLFTDDTSVALPVSLDDIISLEDPYGAQTGWIDFGATVEASTYERTIDSEGFEIQQTSGTVLEEITDISRILTVSIGEVKAEHLVMLEESGGITTIAAVGGSATAIDQVKFGAFSDVSRHRVAFVAQRSKQSGIVDEGSVERGRFLSVVLYNVAISADSSEVNFEKGNLVELPMSFTAFPEDGETAGQEFGCWFDESAGTQ